ncbi:hypothetical protein [Kibdelosporangium aridum]|uniref:hypothetical protein n=1 Tax=Kibdelosporangium aridum TaxID=2030 RepID=UPI0035E96DCB
MEFALSVGISVRSPTQRAFGVAGGRKSRRSASGALRPDVSRRVVPRRVRFRRATRSCSAITFATVFSETFQPIWRRSAVILGDP